MTTAPMIEGRRADTDRRRQRALTALDQAIQGGEEISVSRLARAAGVDRTFFYRHRDLLERIHAAAATPPPHDGQATVSRASLQADLANAHERNGRLTSRIRQLERRLSQALGEQVWAESGLGGPADIDQLQRRITTLEQHVVDLQGQLEERCQELDAARAANRELTRLINK